MVYYTGSELEREGHDRSDINLPGNQLQLLKDIASVAKCMVVYFSCISTVTVHFFLDTAIVVILYNAGPLDVSWAVNSSKVMAILESFLPAQVS